jgi:hypothetical protein
MATGRPFRHTNETFNVVARDANAAPSKNLDGNKKDAAEALFLLQESAKKYFGCIVCGRTVFTKRPVKHRLDTKITQGDAAGRELVRVGRKHCDEFHRNTWVWNLVPDSGWLTCEERRDGHERAHLDGILHQAMSNAARKMPVPTDKHLDLTILFCQRVTFAQCWLAWCSKSYLRQSKSVVVSNGVRDVAYQRLSEIQNFRNYPHAFLPFPTESSRIRKGPTYKFAATLFTCRSDDTSNAASLLRFHCLKG